MSRPRPTSDLSRLRAFRLAAAPLAAWLALVLPAWAQEPAEAEAAPAPTPSPGVIPGPESFARAPATPDPGRP